MTFLRAHLGPPGEEFRPFELSRVQEAIIEKVQSFGGTVDDLSATGLVAAFGIAPVEEALQHAAFAALALNKIALRAREENQARPATLAPSTPSCPGRPARGRDRRRRREALGAGRAGGVDSWPRRARRRIARRPWLGGSARPDRRRDDSAGARRSSARGRRARLSVFVGREAELGPCASASTRPRRGGADRLDRRGAEPGAASEFGHASARGDLDGGAPCPTDDPVPPAHRPRPARLRDRRVIRRGRHRAVERAVFGCGTSGHAAVRASPPVRRRASHAGGARLP